MKLTEFNGEFQQASYEAWKDPVHSYTSFKDMPDPHVFIVVKGKTMRISHVDAKAGSILIHMQED